MSKPPATRSRAMVRAEMQVTQRLRLAIQDAEFPLGEALSELKFAAWLGLSRTPVREALNALQLEGLSQPAQMSCKVSVDALVS